MGTIYSFNPSDPNNLTKPLKADGTDRFVINVKQTTTRYEGPRTYGELTDTLNFFNKADAPPLFLFLNITSPTALAKTTWETQDKNIKAFKLGVTIKDTKVDAANYAITDYYPVGDLIMPGSANTIDPNLMLLFAHKKIMRSGVAKKVANEGNAVLSIADLTKVAPMINELYTPLGCSCAVPETRMGITQLPVVLRIFFYVHIQNYLTSLNVNTTPLGNLGYNVKSSHSDNSNGRPISNRVYGNAVYPIVSYEMLNDYTTGIYLPGARVLDLKPTVYIALETARESLMNYGRFNMNHVHLQGGPWTDAKGKALAKAICDSEAEPSRNQELFCACIGRKGVEAKLQTVLKNPKVKMQCVSKMCSDMPSFGVFKIQSELSSCTVQSGCFGKLSQTNPKLYGDVMGSTINVTDSCNVPPKPSKVTGSTAAKLSPASASLHSSKSCMMSGGLGNGSMFLIIILAFFLIYAIYLAVPKKSS